MAYLSGIKLCLVSTIPLPFFRCHFTVPISRCCFRTPLPLPLCIFLLFTVVTEFLQNNGSLQWQNGEMATEEQQWNGGNQALGLIDAKTEPLGLLHQVFRDKMSILLPNKQHQNTLYCVYLLFIADCHETLG